MESISKDQINLKHTDLANMFNAYYDESGNAVFYFGRTIEFGDISKLNEKYVTKHICRDGDTWYKLAYQYYSDAKLWWIICKANDIKNPLSAIEAETIINIPSEGIVQSVLDNIV